MVLFSNGAILTAYKESGPEAMKLPGRGLFSVSLCQWTSVFGAST
jgi:hypothetical protein